MGGKSSSKQQTTSTSSNTNIVNDGQFAGAGNVTIDESDHSVTDSNNTDNSIELKDSFNTDNSVSVENRGDYAGNSGNIVLSDSGAIEAAQAIAERSLESVNYANEQSAKTTAAAFSANEKIASGAFSFGEHALDEIQVVATRAIDGVEDFGSNVIDSLSDQSESFSRNLADVTNASLSASERVLSNAAQANSDDKKIIADLARSTSLAGQDIVAKSSERMTMYMAVAVGVGFLAVVIFGSRR